ncbi:MAG: toxin-antitoxin system HicB family antitoxin [bacterium]|nr:toxin-antitoxin system HicB family antitoxin [bacterium]
MGDEPNKPYSGKLTLRIPPNVHAAIATAAMTISASQKDNLFMMLQSIAAFTNSGVRITVSNRSNECIISFTIKASAPSFFVDATKNSCITCVDITP